MLRPPSGSYCCPQCTSETTPIIPLVARLQVATGPLYCTACRLELWDSDSGKILTYAQVLACIYITVNFQLRSSINAGLTERSLYNRFCNGGGLRYLVETALGMQ